MTPAPVMSESARASDEELIARFRSCTPADRRRVADELFSRHYERVARWCFRFAGDRDTAADLAQEVFVKAYRNLDSFQGAARFSTWLYSVMRNECLNRVSRERGPAFEDIDEVASTAAQAAGYDDPLAAVERESAARQVRDLLNRTLDDTERRVFTLHYGEGIPLDGITRLLRLENASGAKAYIVSAKRKLSRAVDRLRARGEVQ
jgi:RNA polymerase sigma-70 factor (ECF subfamily)